MNSYSVEPVSAKVTKSLKICYFIQHNLYLFWNCTLANWYDASTASEPLCVARH